MDDLIRAHLAWLRAGGASPRTVNERAGVLARADRALPLGLTEATHDELAEWLGNPDWSAATRQTYFNHLAGLFTWATNPDRPVLDWNPMAGLRQPHAPRGVPRPLTDDQLAELLDQAAQPYRLFVLLAAFAGLRCCEIAALRRQDVTADLIHIRRGKGGRGDHLDTHPAVWAAVEPLPAGPVATAVGGLADARWVSIRSAVYFRRRLKMPGVSLHRARHWHATALRRAGADLFLIRDAMRHSSVSTTQIYTAVGNGERRLAIHALPVPGHASR